MTFFRKRGGEKFTIPGKYLLFLFTILCVVMIALSYRSSVFFAPLNSVAGTIVTPFQRGLTSVGTWLTNKSRDLAQIRSLQQENASLRSQVDELTTQNTNLQQDEYELNNLRSLYALDQQYATYQKIGARVIAKDAGNWYHSFVIDKGSDDGILKDMNVIAGSGLVGRVIDLGPSWAKVQTVIADNASVSGTVLSTSDNLIVTGDLELYADGVIGFSKLVDDADKAVVGDKIVTSNISDKYLPGILIGYIETIGDDSNHLTRSGTLTPAVDFSHLNEVLVIMQQKDTGED